MKENGLDPEDYSAKAIEKLLTNYEPETLKIMSLNYVAKISI